MIDWLAFVTVFGVTLGASLAIVLVVGLGIRLLATPSQPGRVGDATDAEDDDVNRDGRPPVATMLAWVCFAAFAAIVVIGIYLIVPALH